MVILTENGVHSDSKFSTDRSTAVRVLQGSLDKDSLFNSLSNDLVLFI